MASWSEHSVVRLSVYRRILTRLHEQSVKQVYSHDLARECRVSAAMVRRDLMGVDYAGSAVRGYDVTSLLKALNTLLDGPRTQHVALVGVGNLGSAVLNYFGGRRPKLDIVAAFDRDPAKAGRLTYGVMVHPITELKQVLHDKHISLGIVAVNGTEAQGVVDQLVACGVKGILSFAGMPLRVPPAIFIEDFDLVTALEKVAFFARTHGQTPGGHE
jgi:redox-sensing transcriptional repressor